MMATRVFIPQSLDRYELCHPIDQNDFELINTLVNGVARGESWVPIAMQIIRRDDGQALSESDSPWLGSHALIFRSAAIKALKDLLFRYGELLPLLCAGTELAMFNATCVLDALDESRSSILRFDDGRIMRIGQYSFRPTVIRSAHVFKIPNLRVSPTFVCDPFVQAWNTAGLRGLTFKPVWSMNEP